VHEVTIFAIDDRSNESIEEITFRAG